MSENHFDLIRSSVLSHVQMVFDEIEETMAMKHQEKLALLEDAFSSATDVDELRVAFEQWFTEHSEDLNLEQESTDMWGTALANIEEEHGISFDKATYEDLDSLEEEEEEEEEIVPVVEEENAY